MSKYWGFGIFGTWAFTELGYIIAQITRDSGFFTSWLLEGEYQTSHISRLWATAGTDFAWGLGFN